MKILPALLLISSQIFSQSYWSPSQQITSDSVDSFDHSLIEDVWPSFGKEREILAYVQHTGSRSEIMVLQTDRGGINWLPTPTRITNDTIHDGSPAIAEWRPYNGTVRKVLLVWEHGDNDIYYSFTADSIWSAPAPLSTGIYGGRKPWVANVDSSFGAVWLNHGRILFSEFRNSTWSLPIFITSSNDTLNFNPQLKYVPKAMIIWERQKVSTTNRAIAFTMRNDPGWTVSDTVTTMGDNRNPRFVKLMNYMPLVSFESNRWGGYEIFGISRNNARWESPSSLYALGFDASFMLIPVITSPLGNTSFFWSTAGTWKRVQPLGKDSIALSFGATNNPQFRRAGSSENTSPRISTGLPNGDRWRIWSVWQAGMNGRQTLFGATAEIIWAGVGEETPSANFSLHQNYPNPFNPSTTISFELDRPAHVRLSVFDLLGREVASLLNERKDSGLHRVEMGSTSLSTGMYFYRLSVNGNEKVRKMIVLR
ncbi:MAG: T9SS type A sorting domain-containing protein [bacterium]